MSSQIMSKAEEHKEETSDNGDQKILRIAVLGATGVGKSTLCNVMCSESKEFEVSDSWDSCTEVVKSKTFKYNIDNQQLDFEVIDCPGFFDTDVVLTKMNENDIFCDNIKKCIHLTASGIAGYLLLIPYGRMTAYHAASIRFITEYFPEETKKYVWLIITKTKDKSESDITNEFNNKSKQKKATKLLQQFIIDINHQFIASECVDSKNIENLRHKILRSVSDTYQRNGGPFQGRGIWNAFEKQLKNYEKQQIEQLQQKETLDSIVAQNTKIINEQKNRIIVIGASVFVGVLIAIIVLGYGYDHYTVKLAKSQKKLYISEQNLSASKKALSAKGKALYASEKALSAKGKALSASEKTRKALLKHEVHVSEVKEVSIIETRKALLYHFIGSLLERFSLNNNIK